MNTSSMAIDVASIFENLPAGEKDSLIVRRDEEQLTEPQTVFVDLHDEARGRPQPKMSSFGPQVENIVTSRASVFDAATAQFAFDESSRLTRDPSGHGIVSYADINVLWSEDPFTTIIEKDGATYEAIGLSNVEMYRVQLGGVNDWLEDPLVRIRLSNQTSLWLMMIRRPASETNMACCAFALTGPRCTLQKTSDFGEQIILPAVRFEYSPDLSWMQGLGERNSRKSWHVEQARQRIRLSLSEEGANVLQETTTVEASNQLVINRGFMAFFTSDEEKDGINAVRTPLFMSYLDTDSWERMS